MFCKSTNPLFNVINTICYPQLETFINILNLGFGFSLRRLSLPLTAVEEGCEFGAYCSI